MWRIFSLAILALIPVGRGRAQDKRSLIVEVLQTAGDYGDIAPVWGIVQKDGDIYLSLIHIYQFHGYGTDAPDKSDTSFRGEE